MPIAPERWAEQARYDMETAQAMLESGRYLYVLFCCQQAIEKALKAIIARRTQEFPPRIHNLPRLAEAAALKPGAAQIDFLAELSAYYIQTRYPEDIDALGARATRQIADEALRKSEELTTWLLSLPK